MEPVKKLYRSKKDEMIGGVCAGIAHYFNIDPTLVRLAFAAILLIFGSGILAYIACLIIIPREPDGYVHNAVPANNGDDDDEYDS